MPPKVKVGDLVTCPHCHGIGYITKYYSHLSPDPHVCPSCNGWGTVPVKA